jgi:hypothetical protein
MYFLQDRMTRPCGFGSVSPVLAILSENLTSWCTVPSGNTMQVFAGHTGSVSCGEFTPDGETNNTSYPSAFTNVWQVKEL